MLASSLCSIDWNKQKFIFQNQPGSGLGLWGQSPPKPRVSFACPKETKRAFLKRRKGLVQVLKVGS